MRKFLTEHQKDNIVNFYEDGSSAYEIAKILSIDPSSVYYHLDKNGIKSKDSSSASQKYTLNKKYFEQIDSEDKAYFLGLLASDGCVTDSNKILITLQEEDGYILEKFKNYIGYSGPVYYLKTSFNRKDVARLQITNQKLALDLSKLTIIPRKSLILKFPEDNQVPEKFIRDYIRGVFDGDGSVKVHHSVLTLKFTGTFELLNGIQDKLVEKCKVNKIKMYQAKKDKNTFDLSYGGDRQCIRIYSYLYDNANIFLNRKKDKIVEQIKKRLEIYSTNLLYEELKNRQGDFTPHFIDF